MPPSHLLAVSDLHLGRQENRRVLERIRPVGPADWLRYPQFAQWWVPRDVLAGAAPPGITPSGTSR